MKFSKRKVLRGIPGPHADCKSTLIFSSAGTTNLSTKTINSVLLTNIVEGENRNNRERGVIHIKGFRLRMTFRNRDNQPLWVNVAIVNPKNAFPSNSLPDDNLLTVSKFFKVLGAPDRTDGANNLQTGLEWGTLPIATDEMNVIWHARFKLGIKFNDAAQDFTTGAGGPNYRTLNRYMKCPKKISYNTSAGDSCDQPFYLIVYCSRFEEGAGSPIGNSLAYTQHIVTYFRDPNRS